MPGPPKTDMSMLPVNLPKLRAVIEADADGTLQGANSVERMRETLKQLGAPDIEERLIIFQREIARTPLN